MCASPSPDGSNVATRPPLNALGIEPRTLRPPDENETHMVVVMVVVVVAVMQNQHRCKINTFKDNVLCNQLGNRPFEIHAISMFD